MDMARTCIIESSNDYIFVNQCRNSELMIVHFHKDRYFSNVMIVTTSNTIIHNIYMHQKECFYLDTFINHINKVLKNITFYNDENKQHTGCFRMNVKKYKTVMALFKGFLPLTIIFQCSTRVNI